MIQKHINNISTSPVVLPYPPPTPVPPSSRVGPRYCFTVCIIGLSVRLLTDDVRWVDDSRIRQTSGVSNSSRPPPLDKVQWNAVIYFLLSLVLSTADHGLCRVIAVWVKFDLVPTQSIGDTRPVLWSNGEIKRFYSTPMVFKKPMRSLIFFLIAYLLYYNYCYNNHRYCMKCIVINFYITNYKNYFNSYSENENSVSVGDGIKFTLFILSWIHL